MRRIALVVTLVSLMGVLASIPQAVAEPGNACDHGLQKAAEDAEGGDICTHGPDPAKDAEGLPVFPADAGTATPAPCIGDGVSGYRIEVIYGVPSDVPNNYEASVPAIRQAVGFADSYFEASDGSTTQHLRWLCDPDGQVTVHNVTLAPIGDDGLYTFSDMYGSLVTGKGRGKKGSSFAAKDRIYVTFVDGIGTVYPYCGQANLDRDDSASVRNRNNSGPAYSLIGCWNGTTTLHEIGHNLGAVQLSAPHSSGRFHCYDEADVMCYNDGGSYFLGPDGQSGTADDGAIEMSCVDPLSIIVDVNDQQFDCNQDDYYNPNPPAGSYVATHWNLANSNWVEK